MRHLLVSFVVCLLIVTSLHVMAQEFPPAQPALDFITQNPQDVAVLCYTPGEEHPDFARNPDKRFSLASTYKLVILAEMARQIDVGLIDPKEQIPLADLNAYWLPATDGGRHQAWLDTLSADAETVTLSGVAQAMMRFSSNAAPDYLLSRLRLDGFPELFDTLGLENTDLPEGSYLGFFLVFDNHETGPADPLTLEHETMIVERQRLENLYLTDAEWYEAEQAYQEEKRASLTADPDSISAEIERQATYFEMFDHKGSVSDMLKIMEAAYSDAVFSEETQKFTQSTLNWLLDVNPANRELYAALGTKGGSVPSIMTGVWYAAPQDGEPLVLAVFYRHIPLDMWVDWSETYPHQGLELRVVAGGEGCAMLDTLLEA